MSTNDDFLDVAGALGHLVSQPAAELYASMLASERGRAAADTAPARELVEAGLASVEYGSEQIFLYPPQVAIARAIERRTRRWLADAPDFGSLADTMVRLDDHFPMTEVTNGRVEDPLARQRVMESLYITAKREVRVLQPYFEGDDTPPSDDEWSQLPDHSSTTTVTHRFVYDDRLLRLPGFEDAVRRELDWGAHVRITNDTLPSFLTIIDDDVAAFTPTLGGPGEVTTGRAHVALLAWAFEAIWARAVPMGRNDELSPTLRTVLALVGLGRTNRQISSTLGVHERTVRRRVEDLLDYFGESDRTALVRHAASLSDGM